MQIGVSHIIVRWADRRNKDSYAEARWKLQSEHIAVCCLCKNDKVSEVYNVWWRLVLPGPLDSIPFSADFSN